MKLGTLPLADAYEELRGRERASQKRDQVSDRARGERVNESKPIPIVSGEVVGPPSCPDLAEIANREHRLAGKSAGSMVEHAIRCGEALSAAKEQLNHGEWLPWLAANFEGSTSTADAYRKLAANSQRVGNLEEPTLRKALASISAAETLSFGHHQSVAALDASRPGHLLDAGRRERPALLRLRLDAWRRWGEMLGPAEHSRKPEVVSGRNDPAADRIAAHRARKLAFDVPDDAYFKYRACFRVLVLASEARSGDGFSSAFDSDPAPLEDFPASGDEFSSALSLTTVD